MLIPQEKVMSKFNRSSFNIIPASILGLIALSGTAGAFSQHDVQEQAQRTLVAPLIATLPPIVVTGSATSGEPIKDAQAQAGALLTSQPATPRKTRGAESSTTPSRFTSPRLDAQKAAQRLLTLTRNEL
jgi:hypothetical protein